MSTAVTPVRFEHRDAALGIGTATPRLSWQVVTDDPDWAQTAYELESNGDVVRVDSAEQVLVPWPFEPLAARGRADVRVRVASGNQWTDWSDPSTVEAGLLAPEDWAAQFVSPTRDDLDSPAPILSRQITVRANIASARLYATAHGVYSATVNGHRVGQEILAPGWTSYHHRLRYQTHDVTSLLREGDNKIEFLLGNGWYRGRLAWTGKRALYGDRLALLAQLEVTYDDGSIEVIGTDTTWSARTSGILANDLYDGQRTDLRPAESTVDTVVVVPGDLSRLVAPEGPPIRVTDVLPAVRVWQSPSGRTLVDFGQNVVGWVRLTARNTRAGDEVVVRHAEVLDNDELGTRPLRSAEATDTYLLDDAQEVVLEPSLTFHGFRYAEVTGLDVRPEDVRAVVIGSDLRRTGWFSCSDADLEQFHRNVVWSMRGNFVDIPTDCPQRDERLGWTGDIQIFAPTAAFLFDTAGFLSSWLADLAVEQHPDGSVPYVVPEVLGTEAPTATAWGDAATVVPWVLYQRYADPQILARQFDSMRGWVDKIASLTTDGVWAGGFQFGDWLDPTAPPDDPFAAKADSDVVATAYLARSAEIVAEAAAVLGRDGEHYEKLAAATREAFARHYVTPGGRIISDAPTVYALAIEWALLPSAEQRRHAASRLADLVRGNGFRIATGFVGTPLITDALTTSGHADLAFRLLLEKGCPSWLYPVTMGATTIWERWDSMLPDGTINPGEMTSFNHYALGAVADWMHRTLAGLSASAPGYRHITVKPIPHSALSHASARHLTPYGEASAGWRRADGQVIVEAVIPAGATATVHLPGREPFDIRHGRHSWTVPDLEPMSRPVETVRDLLDTPGLWREAAALLVEHGLGTDDAAIARRAARYLDFPVGRLPRLLDFDGDPHTAEEAFRGLLT
ncbi:alpha-L-rhamnosidase [Kibdelosporangium persicum]|uniref:alpha-L-rhamnosidase n=1 Tax=Kibdelosporangium persicum TaxID=2698649 RepID=A0ABX2F8L0_9PSEU|nr:alpha-L-rhamnosidase [Kibdelosporangium persicum]NRN67140.1 Bacterial alpha-L-rhamnosidase [Kibdelosporangium persicum]